MAERVVEKSKTLVVPLLPLRDIILFPHMVVPLFVGRDRSIRAVESVMEKDRKIFFSLQKNAKANDPQEEDIYSIGTLGMAIQCLKLPDGTVKVLVEGESRGRILRFIPNEPFLLVEVEEVETPCQMTLESEALMRSVKKIFGIYAKLNQRVTSEVVDAMMGIGNPGRLTDMMVVHVGLKLEDKQRLLELESPGKRLEEIFRLLRAEVERAGGARPIRPGLGKQRRLSEGEGERSSRPARG